MNMIADSRRALPKPLTLHVLPAERRSDAREAWLVAERLARDDAPVFCRWDWTELWLEQFGEVVPHQYLVAERDGCPRGAVLLTRSVQRRGPVAIRRLHLGTAGEPPGEGVYVEYNGLCVSADERAEMARGIVTHAHKTRAWDELHLDGFDPAHAAALLAAEPSLIAEARRSPVLNLDGPQDDLVATLASRNARSAIRRSLKALAPYETEWAENSDSALRIFDRLVELHQERWNSQGEPGAFASERFRAFHRTLIGRWLPQGRAVVFGVRQGGDVVAALYGFIVGDTLQYYQGGFRAFDSNKIRPGYAAHLLVAAAARERKLSYYEYLAGDHRYKRELSTGERTLVWARLVRRRPRAVAVNVAREAGKLYRKVSNASRNG